MSDDVVAVLVLEVAVMVVQGYMFATSKQGRAWTSDGGGFAKGCIKTASVIFAVDGRWWWSAVERRDGWMERLRCGRCRVRAAGDKQRESSNGEETGHRKALGRLPADRAGGE